MYLIKQENEFSWSVYFNGYALHRGLSKEGAENLLCIFNQRLALTKWG